MRFTVLLFIVISAVLSFKLEAAERSNPRSEQKCYMISKSAAMQSAARRTGGKVLSASLSRTKPPVYRVKVISKSGRVKTIKVNACR